MTMVIETSFIPLSLLTIVLMMVIWENRQWVGKNISRNTDEKKLQESMDRYTGHRGKMKIFNFALTLYQTTKI